MPIRARSKPHSVPRACWPDWHNQIRQGDHVKQFGRFAVLAVCAALAACSFLEGDKIDYKSAGKGISLEVPPDLTALSRDSRYTVPGGPVTASSYQVGQAAPA